MSDTWARYYNAAGEQPRDTLLLALDLDERELGSRARNPFAVDLGCGTGRDTAELLRRGWRVLAIDSEPAAIDRLTQSLAAHGDLAARLETQVARFEDASWPTADLVNSSFALPFCPPERFGEVWSRIVSSLAPRGRFCGQLFGDRDEWASPSRASARDWESPPGISFHSREDVLSLLREFEVEQLDEVEEDGTTAVCDPKHWHLFHIVARRR